MQMYWLLFSLGVLISLVGYIWLTVVGFKRNVVWGLLVLLFSPVSAIIFAATNWYEAKKPFLVYLVSMIMMIGAVFGFYGKLAPLVEQTMQRVHNGELTKEEAKRQLTYALINGQSSLPPLKAASGSHESKQTNADVDTGKTVEKKGTVADQGEAKQTKQEQMTTTEATDKQKSPEKQKAEKEADASAAKQREATPVPAINQVQPDPLAQKKKIISDKVAVSLSRISHYLGRYFIITLKSGSQHRGLLRKVGSTKLVLDRKLYGGNFTYRIRKDEIKSIQMLKREPKEP